MISVRAPSALESGLSLWRRSGLFAVSTRIPSGAGGHSRTGVHSRKEGQEVLVRITKSPLRGCQTRGQGRWGNQRTKWGVKIELVMAITMAYIKRTKNTKCG